MGNSQPLPANVIRLQYSPAPPCAHGHIERLYDSRLAAAVPQPQYAAYLDRIDAAAWVMESIIGSSTCALIGLTIGGFFLAFFCGMQPLFSHGKILLYVMIPGMVIGMGLVIFAPIYFGIRMMRSRVAFIRAVKDVCREATINFPGAHWEVSETRARRRLFWIDITLVGVLAGVGAGAGAGAMPIGAAAGTPAMAAMQAEMAAMQQQLAALQGERARAGLPPLSGPGAGPGTVTGGYMPPMAYGAAGGYAVGPGGMMMASSAYGMPGGYPAAGAPYGLMPSPAPYPTMAASAAPPSAPVMPPQQTDGRPKGNND